MSDTGSDLVAERVAERIMVADDEEIIREMLFSYLSEEGYQVEMASDGREALTKVQSQDFDVVITDIRMPGPNGMEILRAAKTRNADTEVIVMTAFSTEDLAIEAVRLGAYDYLKKPIEDLGLFALLIRQILQKQSLARENNRLMSDLRERNTELKSANSKLTSMATTDPLTGVYNRRYLLGRLDQQFQQTVRYGNSFAVLMMDIDHFKRINDHYGHQVGDAVLQHFVKVVQGLIRATDLLGRYGGEEFVLVLHGTEPEQAEATADRLRSEIERTAFVSAAVNLNFTVSVGVATAPACGAQSPADLIKLADDALYRAKSEGRNRAVMAPTAPVAATA